MENTSKKTLARIFDAAFVEMRYSHKSPEKSIIEKINSLNADELEIVRSAFRNATTNRREMKAVVEILTDTSRRFGLTLSGDLPALIIELRGRIP